jgi:3-oxoacyl-ACP reductase-like protein
MVLVVGKTEEKGPLGKPRRRWENEIRMDLGEFGWEL